MQAILQKEKLMRVMIPKDGACLFRAVAEQIYGTQELHWLARKLCVETLIQYQEIFKHFVVEMPFDHHVNEMSKVSTWGGHVELGALSLTYSVNFKVYTIDQVIEIDNSFKKTLLLCYVDGNHYDNVYPQDHFLLMQDFQKYVYSLIIRALPSLGIEQPHEYKNIALEEWKNGCSRTRNKDLAFCKKVRNEKLLSGYYRKTKTDSQIPVAKLKTPTRKKKQQQPQQPPPFTINNHIFGHLPSSNNNYSEPAAPKVEQKLNEIIMDDEYFPSLTPHIKSKAKSQSVWGKPKVWGSPKAETPVPLTEISVPQKNISNSSIIHQFGTLSCEDMDIQSLLDKEVPFVKFNFPPVIPFEPRGGVSDTPAPAIISTGFVPTSIDNNNCKGSPTQHRKEYYPPHYMPIPQGSEMFYPVPVPVYQGWNVPTGWPPVPIWHPNKNM